jgi:tetratricopeptide (TPR) repeat protein
VPDADHHLRRAQQALDLDRPELAVREARAALAIEPDAADAHWLLATGLHEIDNADPEAEAAARTAVRLDPESVPALATLGMVLVDLDELDEAATLAESVMRLAPWLPFGFALLAQVRQEQRRYDDMLRLTEEMLRLDPDNRHGIHLRVAALHNLGREAEAHTAIRDALANDPEDPQSHTWQGHELLRAGRYWEAEHHFNQALRLAPTFLQAHVGLALARTRLTRARQAAAKAARRPATRRVGVALFALWLVLNLVRAASRPEEPAPDLSALPGVNSILGTDGGEGGGPAADEPVLTNPPGWTADQDPLGRPVVLLPGMRTERRLTGPAGGDLFVLRDTSGLLGGAGRTSAYPGRAELVLGRDGEARILLGSAPTKVGGRPATAFDLRIESRTEPEGVRAREIVVADGRSLWVVGLRSTPDAFARERAGQDRLVRTWRWPP